MRLSGVLPIKFYCVERQEILLFFMSKKVSRIIGGIMLILAVAFLFVALGHPEMSFPWGNGITYTLYAIYALIMVVLFIAPFKKK